jgi:PhnB protein
MSFAAYLGFRGNAREAMTFYADVFGAKDLQVMTFGDMPPGAQMPGMAADAVMHSQLSAGPGAPLMAADLPPGHPGGGGNMTVYHAAPDTATATAIFTRLAKGGTVSFPLAQTFWSPLFGGVTDRFGTAWMITVAPGA